MNYKEKALKMLEEGRVVFPVMDIEGNITGVIGRHNTLSPKYITCGTGFFGNFSTKQNEIIITEGITDVFMAQMYKYDNVVCPVCLNPEDCFNDNVLKTLSKINKKIILFFDNDNLGQKSAKAILDKMKKHGIDAFNYQHSGIVDMTDFLKKGYSPETLLAPVNNLFSTGIFTVNGAAAQKFHDTNNNYDDDVVSEKDVRQLLLNNDIDGYVSNIGTEVTIHIKPELKTEANIEFIKTIFGLYKKHGVTKVTIEETGLSLQ